VGKGAIATMLRIARSAVPTDFIRI